MIEGGREKKEELNTEAQRHRGTEDTEDTEKEEREKKKEKNG